MESEASPRNPWSDDERLQALLAEHKRLLLSDRAAYRQIDDSLPEKLEIVKAIKALRNNKASTDVAAEMLKATAQF